MEMGDGDGRWEMGMGDGDGGVWDEVPQSPEEYLGMGTGLGAVMLYKQALT